MPSLLGSIRRWLGGGRLRTRKCHRRSFEGFACDAYFHNFEPCERGDDNRPRRPPDLSGPAHLLIFEHDVDLQGNPLAIDVPELNEGLLGDINGMLERVKLISKKEAKRWMGSDVRRRTRLG